MQLAMYKGPAGTLQQKALHWLICALDSVRQSGKRRRLVLVRYSHCELVIAGVCYSSSNRDGGVRPKVIDLASGHWDVFHVDGDEAAALAWFRQHDGQNYDWYGVLRFCRPLRCLPSACCTGFAANPAPRRSAWPRRTA